MLPCSYAFASFALYAAQRLFVASTMRFRPAALSLRFFGATCFGGVALAFFVAAYLLR